MSYLESQFLPKKKWKKILRGTPSKQDLEAFRKEKKTYQKLGKIESQLSA